MKLICVGGASAHCGKTSVAVLLLREFRGWAAIKVTPSRPGEACPHGEECGACSPPEGNWEVITDPQILASPGKDTHRFIEAGVSSVLWVRSLPECLPIALQSALAQVSDAPGVIVESTTAIPLLDGLHILVVCGGVQEIKDSARKCIDKIDLVALNVKVSPEHRLPNLLKDVGRIMPVHPMLSLEDSANRAFLQACRAAVGG